MSTKIPYLDEVWNPTTGCSPCSPGCEHCYARRMFGRHLWKHRCPDCSDGEVWDGNELVACSACGGEAFIPEDFTPTFHADRLDQPLRWRKPRVVGVSFMGDLFHEGITDEQISRVCMAMHVAPQHRYVLLTKRPARLRTFFAGAVLPDNWWPGVTVVNQDEADRNIPILLDTPAAHRWLSIEPMLGPVDLSGRWNSPEWYCERCDTEVACMGVTFDERHVMCGEPVGEAPVEGIDWVVLGGESGPGARPMQPEWAIDAWRQCREAGVPYYFKQWGRWAETHASATIGALRDRDSYAMVTTKELPWRQP